jgi:hypothetical protein
MRPIFIFDLKEFIIPSLRLSAVLLSLILLGYVYRSMRDRGNKRACMIEILHI